MKFISLLLIANSLVRASPTKQKYVNLELKRGDDNMLYIQHMNIGTPKQKLVGIEIDTGSSDFALSNSTFFPKQSSTFNNTFEVFQTSYGSIAPFYINKVYDTLSFKNFEIKNFPFAYAPNNSAEHFNGNFGGILGLGTGMLEALEPVYPNFPFQLKNAGFIDEVMFSIYGSGNGHNTINFGGVNVDAYKGTLIKVPFNHAIGQTSPFEEYYWSGIAINQIKVGDVIVSDKSTLFEIDTGSSTLVPPDNIGRNILQVLVDKSKGDYVFQDESYYFRKDLVGDEWFRFDVQGYELKFTVSDLMGGSIESNGKTYTYLDMYLGYELGLNINIMTLPNQLLKYTYTIWDYENYAMYFADIIDLDDKPSSKSIVAITNTVWPIQTTTAPDATNTYSTFYWEQYDTSISGSYKLSLATDSSETNSFSVTSSSFAASTSESVDNTSNTGSQTNSISSSVPTGGCYARV